jgi:hypothetical protein
MSSARSLLTWGKRRFRRGFGSFRSWFRGKQNLSRGTGSTEGGFGVDIGKGLSIGKFLPSPSMLTELYKSLKIVGLKVQLSGHLETLSKGYGGHA